MKQWLQDMFYCEFPRQTDNEVLVRILMYNVFLLVFLVTAISFAIFHAARGAYLMALILLAGLQSIPEELDEAARVDGAGPFRRFLTITLPLLRPAILLALLLPPLIRLVGHWIPEELFMVAIGVLAARSPSAGGTGLPPPHVVAGEAGQVFQCLLLVKGEGMPGIVCGQHRCCHGDLRWWRRLCRWRLWLAGGWPRG